MPCFIDPWPSNGSQFNQMNVHWMDHLISGSTQQPRRTAVNSWIQYTYWRRCQMVPQTVKITAKTSASINPRLIQPSTSVIALKRIIICMTPRSKINRYHWETWAILLIQFYPYPLEDALKVMAFLAGERLPGIYYYTGMDKTCVYTSFYGFICVSGRDCVQVIPAYPPGGDTRAGSFGNGRFLTSTSFTNSRFVRCTCASLRCHFRIYKISCLR